jgi:CelD/BcsL family acetyltransferase involved in cellulose biosynthesis
MPELIRAGFADGETQVWCLFEGEQPVAAQVWVRRHSQATIFKLAYDQDRAKQSVGTVLTMAAIDFGWGDDPYKQGMAARAAAALWHCCLQSKAVNGPGIGVAQCWGAIYSTDIATVML